MSDLAVVDYGMGNLRSVQKACERLGHAAAIAATPDAVAAARRVILPGVGAFGDAMTRLNAAGLADPLRDHVRAGKPFLGICLGLQLLFDHSTEGGDTAGLGLFAGDVVRFPDRPGFKVPHMGWNQVTPVRDCPLLRGLPARIDVYFVHSYLCRPADPQIVAGTTDYGGPFAAVVGRGATWATQFHPEKSQAVGLAMLGQFLAL